jgi:hypothetical protein
MVSSRLSVLFEEKYPVLLKLFSKALLVRKRLLDNDLGLQRRSVRRKARKLDQATEFLVEMLG